MFDCDNHTQFGSGAHIKKCERQRRKNTKQKPTIKNGIELKNN